MEFSKREILKESWQAAKENISFLITVVLILGGINILVSIVQNSILEETGVQAWVFIIASNLFQMGVSLGVVRVALNILDKKENSIALMFGSFHLLLPYLLATMIVIFLVLLAALPGIFLLMVSISWDWGNILNFNSFNTLELLLPALLIAIPAMYLSLRLQFYNYFLVEEECEIFASIQKSAEITKGWVGELFLIEMIITVLILISLIPLGLGLLVSIPLAIMLVALIFRKLKSTA